MDTRDYLFSVIQDRSIPVRLRRQKLLACAHDFQLSLDKMSCSSGKISAVGIKNPDMARDF